MFSEHCKEPFMYVNIPLINVRVSTIITHCSAEYAEIVRPDGSTELLPVSGGMVYNSKGLSTSVSFSLSPSSQCPSLFPFLSLSLSPSLPLPLPPPHPSLPYSLSLPLPLSFSLLLLGAKVPDSHCSRGDHQPWGGDQGESRVCGKATDKDVS